MSLRSKLTEQAAAGVRRSEGRARCTRQRACHTCEVPVSQLFRRSNTDGVFDRGGARPSQEAEQARRTPAPFGKLSRARLAIGTSVIMTSAMRIVLACVLGFFLALQIHAQSCTSNPLERIDCGAFVPDISQEQCQARGCCWDPASPPVPYCFYQTTQGYTASNVQDTPSGFTAVLSMNAAVPAPFEGAISPLLLAVDFETSTRLHIKLTDPSSARFEVPSVVQTPSPPGPRPAWTDYAVQLVPGAPGGLVITRNSTGAVLLNTAVPGLVYTDMYLSMTSSLPPQPVMYGIGEHVTHFQVPANWSTYTQFARDQGTPVGPQYNLYGSYPFYVRLEDDGSAHGVFMLNVNANDVVVDPQSISWRTVGGVLEFYVFTGPSPMAVVQQYTQVFGTTFMPPMWSLGFHLCRWGYNSTNETATVNYAMRAAGLPQDVQWNDIGSRSPCCWQASWLAS